MKLSEAIAKSPCNKATVTFAEGPGSPKTVVVQENWVIQKAHVWVIGGREETYNLNPDGTIATSPQNNIFTDGRGITIDQNENGWDTLPQSKGK